MQSTIQLDLKVLYSWKMLFKICGTSNSLPITRRSGKFPKDQHLIFQLYPYNQEYSHSPMFDAFFAISSRYFQKFTCFDQVISVYNKNSYLKFILHNFHVSALVSHFDKAFQPEIGTPFLSSRCQFHQRFTRAFFVRTSFRQLFSCYM